MKTRIQSEYSKEFWETSKELKLTSWEMKRRHEMGILAPKKTSIPEDLPKEKLKTWKVVCRQGFLYVVKPGEELVCEEDVWVLKPTE